MSNVWTEDATEALTTERLAELRKQLDERPNQQRSLTIHPLGVAVVNYLREKDPKLRGLLPDRWSVVNTEALDRIMDLMAEKEAV
jgi:hypothetical protein